MLKAIKLFWSDYNEMCMKPSMKWLRKHWKGYILMLFGSFIMGYSLPTVIEKVSDWKDSKRIEANKES